MKILFTLKSWFYGIKPEVVEQYQILDGHLSFINNEEGKFIPELPEQLQLHLINIGVHKKGEIGSRVYKYLEEDGMVYIETTETGKKTVLSIKGFVHINSGGYERAYKKSKYNVFYNRLFNTLTIAISFIAIFISIKSISMQEDSIDKIEKSITKTEERIFHQQQSISQLEQSQVKINLNSDLYKKSLEEFRTLYQNGKGD